MFIEDIEKYYNSFVAFEFSENKITVLHNQYAIHGLSVAFNLLHNALLKPENSSIKTSMDLTRLEEDIVWNKVHKFFLLSIE